MPSLHSRTDTCIPVDFLVAGPLRNNIYLIKNEAATMVVDPTCDADDIIEAAGEGGIDVILLTHRHYDHVGVTAELRERTGATVIASAIDGAVITGEETIPGEDMSVDPCPVDHFVNHGDVVQVGTLAWKVIATPGHTAGSMCWYLAPELTDNPQGAPVLLSGDTLFCGTIGRTDFAGGSLKDMQKSLVRLACLPDETVVFPGHEALTTIGAERERVFARFAPPEGESR